MVARTTVTVPDALKVRMDAVKEEVNWSGEAAKCFERVLGNLAARKREKTMEDVVARLRASKLEDEDANYQRGHKTGRSWAENHASYDELKRASDYNPEIIGGSGTWNAPWSGPDWVAFDILGVDVDESIQGNLQLMSEDFWMLSLARGAVEAYDRGDEFLVGFIDGTRAVWDEVADRL